MSAPQVVKGGSVAGSVLAGSRFESPGPDTSLAQHVSSLA